jgi:hypothetical protein
MCCTKIFFGGGEVMLEIELGFANAMQALHHRAVFLVLGVLL